MARGRAKIILAGLFALVLAGMGGHGNAQDFRTIPSSAEEVRIDNVRYDLETMGLIWIQEGNVKRLAYVIQTGDTLWDIAGRYLNSSYYWPKIWERNSFIINPHLIFPGDILYVYPEGVTERPVTVEGSTAAFTVTPYGKKIGRQIVYQRMLSTGFITIEELEAAGKIVDNINHQTLLGKDDIVYVNVGKVDRVEAGDPYSIIRVKENPKTGKYHRVRHPITGVFIGYQIYNLGELQVFKVQTDISEARIKESHAEILNGDLIVPYPPLEEEKVDLTETAEESLYAYIIASKNSVKLLGQNDIVYIDRGADDGVMRGNVFIAYEPCEVIYDSVTRDKIRLPEKILGNLVVLEARKETSVALVIETIEELAVGEHLYMSKYSSWEIEGISQAVEVDQCDGDPKCRLISAEEYKQGMDNPYCELEEEIIKKSRWKRKRSK